MRTDSWLIAFADRPWIAIARCLGILGTVMSWRAMWRAGRSVALGWSQAAVFGIISSVGLVMFPFILPSNTHPDSSLSVWDASSSHQTLFVMLVGCAIFLPLIMIYTVWVYRAVGQGHPGRGRNPDNHAYWKGHAHVVFRLDPGDCRWRRVSRC